MHLEYNIIDKCNLNCASCAAFSPLVKDSKPKSLDNIKNDFEKIYKLTDNGEKVDRFVIMGGEPLLHLDINDIIIYFSILFKKSEIRLFTNGILLPKMNQEFFEILRYNYILLCVSEYHINFDYNK